MTISVKENRSAQIETSVIIVSWNVRELLKECLASLESYWKVNKTTIEVIVVDGGSEDGSNLLSYIIDNLCSSMNNEASGSDRT